MILSTFWGNFVSMEGRKKEDKFRSLEVRRKLIALKNNKIVRIAKTLSLNLIFTDLKGKMPQKFWTTLEAFCDSDM